MIGRLPVVALAVGILALATPVAARAEPADSALQQFGSCLSTTRAGDLLLLIDQSRNASDSAGGRAAAAGYLLDQLESYTRGARVHLDVKIAGFDERYRPVTGWTRLGPTTRAFLRQGAEDFRNRVSGIDTDYVAALDGARGELRERARGSGLAKGSGQRCQAIAWFAGSSYEIAPRTTEARRDRYGTTKPYAPRIAITHNHAADEAEQAGRRTLCRDGGLADQLRAADVLLFAYALGDTDLALMKAAATGEGCGRAVSGPVGDFRLANSPDELLFAADGAADPSRLPDVTRIGVCAQALCRGGTVPVVLDASVLSAHIVAGGGRPGVEVLVRPPTGVPVRFAVGDPGAARRMDIAGQRISARWLTDNTLDLTIDRTDLARWSGAWSLSFLDPAGPAFGSEGTVQVRLVADVVPTLASAVGVPVRSGTTVRLRVGLREESTNRTLPESALPGTVTVAAELRPVAGAPVRPPGELRLGREFALPLAGVRAGTAVVRLTLRVRTVAAGGEKGSYLPERVLDVPLTVLPPQGLPGVAGRLDFGHADGAAALRNQLTVSGPGCAWVERSDVTAAPEGVGIVSVSGEIANSAEHCLRVGAGATARLPLRLDVPRPGAGTVAGTVTVRLAPVGAPQRAQATTAPFIADITLPPKPTPDRALFLSVLLAGIAGPVVLLYALQWCTARIPGAPLLAGVVPATIDGDTAALTLHQDDLIDAGVPSGGARRLALPTGLTLSARPGWWPGDPGHTTLRATTPGRPATTKRLPLAVHNTWAALLDEQAGDRVDVQVFLSAAADAEALARLAEEIRAELPGTVARARER